MNMMPVENLLRVSNKNSPNKKTNEFSNKKDDDKSFKDIINEKNRPEEERKPERKKPEETRIEKKTEKKEKPNDKVEEGKNHTGSEAENNMDEKHIVVNEPVQTNKEINETPLQTEDEVLLGLMNIDQGELEVPKATIQDLVNALRAKDSLAIQNEDSTTQNIQTDVPKDEDLEKILLDLNLVSIKSEETVSKEALKKDMYSQRIVVNEGAVKAQNENEHNLDENVAQVDLNPETKIPKEQGQASGFLDDMDSKSQLNTQKDDAKVEDIELGDTVDSNSSGFTGNLKSQGAKIESVHIKPVEQAFRRDVMSQISDRIKVESAENFKSLEINLEPESLGKVLLRIVSENGTLSAKIITSNEKVKAAIDVNMEEVKETLAQQGIDIKSIDVSVDSEGKGEGFEGLFKGRGKSGRKPSIGTELGLDEMNFEDVNLNVAVNPYDNTKQEFNYLA
ncbi:hook-length control protein FliK [Peptoclostridium litorale DSM 5388]|uniref:Flagellar hook-length control protein-like C-terminal domain-containing protein n=1 Tax=Peptoclostridium litorale DSM 5388 TaxID=1121324 RepID=A0A069RG87_PEPLI|nr:flagellar hook-length control protein FliK [Peptoclostridium litorale]KDR95165.1 hypothetical protein CLIT_11c01940 [Peptoclostridium litorale DSM 5388]SIN73974.1 hook-length control protein FliK [Peptoclostridium litorale DSM 5388]